MGDWTGRVGRGRGGYEGVVEAHTSGDRKDDGKILDFCLLNNAAIKSTFYEHQTSHKRTWTWYCWNQDEVKYERSIIDLLITNKKSMLNLFRYGVV